MVNLEGKPVFERLRKSTEMAITAEEALQRLQTIHDLMIDAAETTQEIQVIGVCNFHLCQAVRALKEVRKINNADLTSVEGGTVHVDGIPW